MKSIKCVTGFLLPAFILLFFVSIYMLVIKIENESRGWQHKIDRLKIEHKIRTDNNIYVYKQLLKQYRKAKMRILILRKEVDIYRKKRRQNEK